jgi:hypothetical protein
VSRSGMHCNSFIGDVASVTCDVATGTAAITHRTCSGSPRTENWPFSMTLANFVATKNSSRLPFRALAADDAIYKGQRRRQIVRSAADTPNMPLTQPSRS